MAVQQQYTFRSWGPSQLSGYATGWLSDYWQSERIGREQQQGYQHMAVAEVARELSAHTVALWKT